MGGRYTPYGDKQRTATVTDVAGNKIEQPVAPEAPPTFTPPPTPGSWEEEAGRMAGAGYASGGEVTKTGWAKIHEGEPIVPAEVARSSVVIDSLKALASGGGAAQDGGGGIQIGDIHIHSNSGDGRTLAQQFREELEKQMSDFQFKHKSEEVYRRANRAFIA